MIPLWESTREFRIYSPFLIPGPVQTAAYIRALLKAVRDRRPNLVDHVTNDQAAAPPFEPLLAADMQDCARRRAFAFCVRIWRKARRGGDIRRVLARVSVD